MLKLSAAIATLLLTITVAAQHTVRFEIKSLPTYHFSGSAIYAAGSFNAWNPQHEKYKFQQNGKGTYFFDLTLDSGTYEYKITRGGWDKTECKTGGVGKENRVLKISSDTTIELIIEEWVDHFSSAPRKSTASRNVKIIDTAFVIPQLKRTRRIWVYLPQDYSNSNKHYPVLYLQDGQNVFDDITSFSGEWGVDEFLDTSKLRSCIVVAIDNGGDKRLNEYSPYDFILSGNASASKEYKGEGIQYVDFLTKTLKPYIDKKYHTLKDKPNTFIAGSSMGGLISIYAVLKYPKVFGAAGVFSPAFWLVEAKIFDDIKAKSKKVNSKIYFYAGKQESETMVPLTLKIFETMNQYSKSKMTTIVRDDGKHNEVTWRKEFPLFYKWIVTN